MSARSTVFETEYFDKTVTDLIESGYDTVAKLTPELQSRLMMTAEHKLINCIRRLEKAGRVYRHGYTLKLRIPALQNDSGRKITGRP